MPNTSHTSLLAEAPLAPLAGQLRDGSLPWQDALTTILARLEAVDPVVRAFLPEPGRPERVLHEGKALARRYLDPAARPPLFCVPVGVKDILRVEGLPTRAGSRLPAALFAGPEAAAVSRLRAAGAVVLGKTVTTEFAYFEPGPTRNPHNPEHTPGGSSSGSAAAVAAGLCPLALGTQTAGSVIRPASFCGVIGFKPTQGRIPLDGILLISPTLDQVGLFTQDLAGMALAASILCDGWRGIETLVRPPVLGVPEGPYLSQADDEMSETFETCLDALGRAGFVIRRVPCLADIEEVNERHFALMAAEMAEIHREWYRAYGHLYRPRTAALIERGLGMTMEEKTRLRESPLALRRDLAERMRHAEVDLWLAPAATGAAPRGVESTGDPVMNVPWTQAGMPVITIPMGKARNGLPLGLQIIASFGKDEELLAYTLPLAKDIGRA